MSLVCLSSANCLQAFLCIIFRRGFLLERPCRPIWCSVRCMVWALTGWPPALQPLQQCWQHSYVYSQTHPLDMTLARAFNFFGRPWQGLFWVKPALLNRCMVLATVLQLSFRVLATFLYPTLSLWRATIIFFRSLESSLPWCVLTFVASGLDINGYVLSYFEGTANLQAVHSLLYIVAKCHFFIVVTWKYIRQY